MSARQVKRRSGLTLLEVVVALTITAFVLLGARAVVDGIAAIARADDAEDRGHLAAMNGRRLLLELGLDARAGIDPSATFGGDDASATWDTWCRVPRGWKERCRATVSLARDSVGAALILETSIDRDATLALVRLDGTPVVAYLDDARFGGRWVPAWGPSTARPVALGVLSQTDTLILPTSRSMR